jgi:hypothetical protein
MTALFALCTLAGCPKDDAQPDSQSPPAHDAGMAMPCAKGTPELTVGEMDGLTAMGKHKLIQARVIAADHQPPERYYNTWTVQFLDDKGEPLDDVKVENACAYMPLHLHGNPPRKVTPQDDPDKVELNDLNLFMPGAWEIQLAVTSPSAASGPAKDYTNCDAKTQRGPGSELIVLTVCQPND